MRLVTAANGLSSTAGVKTSVSLRWQAQSAVATLNNTPRGLSYRPVRIVYFRGKSHKIGFMFDVEETICAIASPPGPARRGVIRLTGPNTRAVLEGLPLLARVKESETGAAGERFSLAGESRPRLHRCRMPLGFPFGLLDITLLYWPDGRSYTGQPSAEVHVIGAAPILQRILDCCCSAGARMAARGEFTLRAFLAGRLDLTQAEAVLGVIDADSEHGLSTALDQLTGGIGDPLRGLRAELLELLADVEAALDFVDEDIQFISDEELAGRLYRIATQVDGISERMRSQGRAGDVPLIVLWGPANAGKSSLLNRLSGEPTAIVSDVVGTTRDPVEVRLQVGTREWRLVDTAGLERQHVHREGSAAVIAEDARMLAEQALEHADVRLWCQDWSDVTVDNEDAAERPMAGKKSEQPQLRVATKGDLLTPEQASGLEQAGWLVTSVQEDLGIPELLDAVADSLDRGQSESGVVAETAARCRQSLESASESLETAAAMVHAGGGQELIAADIRAAIDAIGEVTGQIYTDDILDSIFSRFCIGK